MQFPGCTFDFGETQEERRLEGDELLRYRYCLLF